ncbi:hypothetical protein AB0L75_30325 [Streptomyces sp. NPDC052101]|uniref:hypothetical protein n=1 Tax=Streptomyces sp. NPDC052101 TaxID=3155763 RepID=UPI003428CAAA
MVHLLGRQLVGGLLAPDPQMHIVRPVGIVLLETYQTEGGGRAGIADELVCVPDAAEC